MSRLLPHGHLSCRTGGKKRRIISADEVGDNVEHCQFETVGVYTLSDETKQEQSHREEGWGLHKLTYLWAKNDCILYSFIKKK